MRYRLLVASTSTLPDSRLAELLLPFKQDADYETTGKWDAWNRLNHEKSIECHATLFCQVWTEREEEKSDEEWLAHVMSILNHRRYYSHAMVDCHI